MNDTIELDPRLVEFAPNDDICHEVPGSSILVVITLLGIFYSLLSAMIAFLLGAGFWIILASYAAGGSLAVVFAAAVHVVNLRSAHNEVASS